ncbi:hypothetical protein [Candidatus Vampirococcus lugosii]|uniref:Cohesin domain-containing protein n=1 Tax=Candidatus Vampirococcus lugosii TaxID=2789015 RepID=A0ABS5QMB7_9BACT|nr:hypothetical protein [Candidatus Vampirococcus lugosii]MBS8122109.1 hypothetical protein [Candidatus Vampirococcus lugosii]
MKLESIKENLLALVLAFILAFSIMFVFSTTDLLKADILGIQDKEENIRGDVYSNLTGGQLKIVSNTNLKGISAASFTVVYDPSELEILASDLDSKYNFNTSFNEGVVNIYITDIGEIKLEDEMFVINGISSDYIDSLNVSDFMFNFTDGSSDSPNITSN